MHLENARQRDSKHSQQSCRAKKIRERPASFSDYYTQARSFWKSMSDFEKRHIVNAFAFELGKCELKKIRTRTLGHLKIVDEELHRRVSAKLGMPGEGDDITPPVEPMSGKPSPAVSQTSKTASTIAGLKVGVLVANEARRPLSKRSNPRPNPKMHRFNSLARWPDQSFWTTGPNSNPNIFWRAHHRYCLMPSSWPFQIRCLPSLFPEPLH